MFGGLVFMTRTRRLEDSWKVSGRYGQTHYQDKSHAIVQEQQYWIGNSDPAARRAPTKVSEP